MFHLPELRERPIEIWSDFIKIVKNDNEVVVEVKATFSRIPTEQVYHNRRDTDEPLSTG